jgi:hypothetical protein
MRRRYRGGARNTNSRKPENLCRAPGQWSEGLDSASFTAGVRAESAAPGNRDIVAGMAGQTNGDGDDKSDNLIGSAAVEMVALRGGRGLALMIHPCGVE